MHRRCSREATPVVREDRFIVSHSVSGPQLLRGSPAVHGSIPSHLSFLLETVASPVVRSREYHGTTDGYIQQATGFMALVTLWLAKEKVCGPVGINRGYPLSVVICKGTRNVCESGVSPLRALFCSRLSLPSLHLLVVGPNVYHLLPTAFCSVLLGARSHLFWL